MGLSVCRVAVCAWCLSVALAQAACVTNDTDQTLFFTIDGPSDGARRAASVEPGAALCLPGAERPVFRVFASVDDVEGCSRIAGPSGRDALLDFRPADNCRWSSHGE